MAIREFEAHEWKKKSTDVRFTTTDGEKMRFTVAKPTRVRKHVRFKTRDRKRG